MDLVFPYRKKKLHLPAKPIYSFTGRIDYFEPNHHSLATHDYRIFSLVALNIQVYKSIVISPNIIAEFYEKQSNGTKIQPGITPRITFYWKY